MQTQNGITEIIAADGCEDGYYEESATLKEDEMFAQAWFSMGHSLDELEDCHPVEEVYVFH